MSCPWGALKTPRTKVKTILAMQVQTLLRWKVLLKQNFHLLCTFDYRKKRVILIKLLYFFRRGKVDYCHEGKNCHLVNCGFDDINIPWANCQLRHSVPR